MYTEWKFHYLSSKLASLLNTSEVVHRSLRRRGDIMAMDALVQTNHLCWPRSQLEAKTVKLLE